MPKKTWQTEIYSLCFAAATCYQAYQLDTINPAAIAEGFTSALALLTMGIPAALTAGRIFYKKYIRKTSAEIAKQRTKDAIHNDHT